MLSAFLLVYPQSILTWSSEWIHTCYIWCYRSRINRRINCRNYIFSSIVWHNLSSYSIVAVVPFFLMPFSASSCYSLNLCIFTQVVLFRVDSFRIVLIVRPWKSSTWLLSSLWASFASLASVSAYFNSYLNFYAWPFNTLLRTESILIALSSISSLISSTLVFVFKCT